MTNVRFQERCSAKQRKVRVVFPESVSENFTFKNKLSRLTEQGRKNAEISPAQKNDPEVMDWKK